MRRGGNQCEVRCSWQRRDRTSLRCSVAVGVRLRCAGCASARSARAQQRRSAAIVGSSWSTRRCCGSAPIRTTCRSRTSKGEGFENKLAELLADKLGKAARLYLVSASDRLRAQYARRAPLRRHHGLRRRATTWCRAPIPTTARPMRSCSKQGRSSTASTRSDDPRLKGKRIGIVAGTPPATYMATQRPDGQRPSLIRWWSTRASILRRDADDARP